MMFLLYALLVFALFYVGVIVGVKQCKKAYGIPKGVSPSEACFCVPPDLEVTLNGDDND